MDALASPDSPPTETTEQVSITGRVQAGPTVPCPPPAAGRCVVWTTWASNRPFPRVVGAAVPFVIETDAGQRVRVDATGAAVSLAVRQRQVDAPEGQPGHAVAREAAWVSLGDRVWVEGDLDAVRGTLAARRINHHDAELTLATPHCLPPRKLEVVTGEAVAESRPAAAPPTKGAAARAAVPAEAPTPATEAIAEAEVLAVAAEAPSVAAEAPSVAADVLAVAADVLAEAPDAAAEASSEPVTAESASATSSDPEEEPSDSSASVTNGSPAPRLPRPRGRRRQNGNGGESPV